MPKKLYKIVEFHGGLNTGSDSRDISDSELSDARDVMVDELGRIRMMGGTALHVSNTSPTVVPNPGYGLFYFRHDRTGGENKSNFIGEHDSGDHATVMTDSGASFVVDALIGGTIYNDTDGSSGIITDNDATTVTVAALTGGSDNSWDTSGDDDYHISMPETGDDYLVLADTDTDTQFFIYSAGEDEWGGSPTAVIDLYTGGTGTTGVKPVFYTVDGALRISDGNFGINNANQWYGYIERTHFSGLKPGGTADIYNGWYSKDQSLAAPTRGLWGGQIKGTSTAGGTNTQLTNSTATAFGLDGAATLLAGTDMDAEFDSGVYIAVNDISNEARLITNQQDGTTLVTVAVAASWANDQYRLFPPAGAGFCMNLDMNSSGGTYVGDKYQYAQTFVYDGGQESLPVIMAGDNAENPSTNDSIEVEIFCTSPFDPRIIGGRIYQRKHPTLNTTGTGREPFSLFVDISLKDGVRENLDDSYSEWEIESGTGSGGPGTDVYMKNKDLEVLTLNALTYEAINGYSADEPTLDCKFRTAVVANRMVYVGNIETKSDDGEDIVLGDAMIKSPVGKFDVFPPGRIIEASVRDGDEIVKLEEYADRILQFKKHKMHLINISQEVEFLEDTFMFKGVSHPAATCKTDFGIAWVNGQGCYLYDGQKVSNLLEKKGRQIIKESEWAQHFVGSGNVPMIGYVPKKRQLIVVDDIGDNDSGIIYLFDMVTQSWVKGHSNTISDADKTNFITDWNNDLVYGKSNNILKWVDDLADASTATSSTVNIKTKDIDFGQPGQVKRIYKFYITHRGSASNIQLSYAINGDQDYTFPDEAGSELPASSAVTDWVTTAITPTTFSCYSIRLRLFSDGNTPADFEINDMTIVFRLKGQR